ncbi:MAG TPA: MBL fold metallo-hydrolase [Burkholderiales bacterium]|nr:MBL fold metallo-hydrolase [Burkholderiales bacterium]
MSTVIDYGRGVSAIDGAYLRPLLMAVHAIVEGDRAAIVDPGTNSSVPLTLEALAAKGIRAEQVDYVILTHIHLDHAGGSGLLMRALPNATLTVHPRGARHMADPTRLVAGTIGVYGEAEMRRMYGDIVPVPAARILETPDGASIRLNGRELAFHETFGHARHHVAIRDSKSGHMFAGDTFGLSYPELDWQGRRFAFATSSPTQFDPAPYHRSIDLIAGLARDAVYVTHYGQVRDLQGRAVALHRQVDAFAALGRREKDAGAARRERLWGGVKDILLDEVRRYGAPFTETQAMAAYGQDVDLNADGLIAWLDSAARG